MNSLIKTIIISILIIATVSGCVPKAETPEKPSAISDINVSSTATLKNTLTPTETQRPTNTNSPKIETTKTATITITSSKTSTITPQPTKDYFKDAEILNVGYLSNKQLLVVLETVSELEDEYFASIGEELFQCEILDDYPNRLYCNGKSAQIGQLVVFVIHSKDSDSEVFSIEVFVPKPPTSTPKPNKSSLGNGKEKPTDDNWTPPPQPTGWDD